MESSTEEMTMEQSLRISGFQEAGKIGRTFQKREYG